jgi:hypothetical protein
MHLRTSIDQNHGIAAQDQHLHAVFLALTFDKQADSAPETNFALVRFAIFLMLDHTGTFKYLGEIRQVAAILRYWCRLIALVDVIRQVGLTPEQEAAHIDQMVIALRDGYNTPVGWLLQVSRFAMATLSAQPPMQRFDWEPRSNFGAIHIDGRRISLEGLQTFAKTMLDRCEHGLRSVLCGLRVPARLVQDEMHDQYNQLQDGYCFLDDAENGLSDLNLDTRLVTHLMNSRSGRDQFFDEAGWNVRRLRRWFEETAALMDSILICMHLTYGQPARAAELCALLFRNHKNAPRNLFWSLKTFMLAGPYSKTRSMTQTNKWSARFFPLRLAKVTKVYLALVRPMELVTARYLFELQSPEVYRYHLFVRRGRLYSGDAITNLLQRVSSDVMGVSIGVSLYRHVAIGFMRATLHMKIATGIDEVFEEEQELDLLDAQAGHSSEVAANYARSQFDFKSLSSDLVQEFLRCSVEWQMLLGKEKGCGSVFIFDRGFN